MDDEPEGATDTLAEARSDALGAPANLDFFRFLAPSSVLPTRWSLPLADDPSGTVPAGVAVDDDRAALFAPELLASFSSNSLLTRSLIRHFRLTCWRLRNRVAW